ncbi:MAG TPA: polyprenol phosphomannose-dependent alpha 1,6 mannosyltransferase MptB [Solirubrobacteraceae bacterium]|nr:polyprenol phosphomannose-dependent alpha 1,6 mannosyltransferase MptB [Solirubrobacteraceae bacterium]
MPASATPTGRMHAAQRNAALDVAIVAWGALGVLGSVLIMVTGGQLTRGHERWWLDPHLPLSGNQAELVLYCGMVALAVAWVGLGRRARSDLLRPWTLWVIAALWSLPLVLAAPVFSRDVYSYFAQGTMLHLGLNPYQHPPTILGQVGHARVLNAVDPFWQHTTAPYGPLFLDVVGVISGLVGSAVVLGAQLVKLLGLAGLVLLAVCVPRLARVHGTDVTRATWLATLNPLVLLALVLPGHNDLLMVGLMVAGVTLAAEDRPLLGVVICALAATIKAPALAAVIFIAVTWARSGAGGDRVSFPRVVSRLGSSAAVALGVFALVSLATGVGLSWVTSTLFSAPAKVHLAITPATGLAYTVFALLRDVGVSSSFTAIQAGFRIAVGAIAVLVALELLRRARRGTMPLYLGWALVALAWGGPAAWPWYFVWGLALLAATPSSPRRLLWMMAFMIAGAVVVKPDGILVFPLQSGPYVMAFYAVVAAVAWYAWRREARRPSAGGVDRPPAGYDLSEAEALGSPALVGRGHSREPSALVKP